jgi:hypothetical protein
MLICFDRGGGAGGPQNDVDVQPNAGRNNLNINQPAASTSES